MPKSGMSAGVIGSMLKKRADDAASGASGQGQTQSRGQFVSHHNCYKNIQPFPLYRLKRLGSYTSSGSRSRPRRTQGVVDVDVDISLSRNWGHDLNSNVEKNLRLSQQKWQLEWDEKLRDKRKEEKQKNITQGITYATMYIGLILISMGVVILFAGIRNGGRDWKGLVLQMTGSIVLLIGFLCSIFPVIQNLCPHFFTFLPQAKKTPQMISVVPVVSQNEGHVTDNKLKMSDQYSLPYQGPRVTLHSFNEMNGQRSSFKGQRHFHLADQDDFDPVCDILPPSYESCATEWRKNNNF